MPADGPAGGFFGGREYRQLQQEGHLRLTPCLEPGDLAGMRDCFGAAWAAGDAASPVARCWILGFEPFRALLRSHHLQAMLAAIFDGQAQLLDYYPNYQPAAAAGEPLPGGAGPGRRDWHRDFTFVRSADGLPLMITVLVFLDDVGEETGPTLVIPASHRVPECIVPRHDDAPRADELALPVRAGEVIVLNSSIVHSRGVNASATPRRGVVLNFGYWWMKPWDEDLPLPAGVRADITPEMEQLLGLRCPGDNLYLVSAI
jgi:hypothetical protein